MITPGVLPRIARNPLATALFHQPFPVSRPRLIRELVLIQDEQGLIVDGAPQLRTLKGKSAHTLVPRLLRLLDGNHSMDEIVAMLTAFSAEDVRHAARLLFDAGLLEEDDSSFEAPQTQADAVGFFRRYLGVTRRNNSGAEALAKLRTAEVLVCVPTGAAPEAAVMSSLLAAMGVGRIIRNIGGPGEWQRIDAQPNHRRLMVALALNGEDPEWNSAIDDFAAAIGTPWLRVALDPSSGRADLGPIFERGQNGCYRCFARVQLMPSTPPPAAAAQGQADRLLWAALAANEIVYWLTEIAPVVLKREFQRYDLAQWISRELRWPRLPGCPVCFHNGGVGEGSAVPENSTGLRTANVFEEYVALQTLPALDYEAEKSGSKALFAARQPKRLTHCLQVGLAAELPKMDTATLDRLKEPICTERAVLSKSLLGTLLTTAAGIREPHSGTRQTKRWAASGGNLGSVELYVAARNITGISPGIYFYQAAEQSLARFQRRSRAIPIDEFIRRVSPGSGSDVDALILFTGAFHRLSRKYGSFAYKLANLDAGVAASQLCLVANTLGVSCRVLNRWADDTIEHQLNLDPKHEIVTGVLELSSSRRTSEPVGSEVFEQSTVSRAPAAFHDLTLAEVTQCLSRESRLLEQDLERKGLWKPRAPRLASGDAQSIALPATTRGGRLVSDVLGRRYSTRRFSTEPVTLQHLSSMLAAAHEGDEEDWICERVLRETLGFMVLAHRVQGLTPGVYRYDPSGHRLLATEYSLTQEIRRKLFAQAEFSSAPAILWITGNLREACNRLGAFGHRQLLLRAGAAGNRAWMAGIALGISGCLVAGVVPSAARQFLGFDGETELSLIALATGYAAQSLK